jgi:MoxR-like ATPase
VAINSLEDLDKWIEEDIPEFNLSKESSPVVIGGVPMPAEVSNIINRYQKMKDEMTSVYFERDEEIESLFIAPIIRHHLIFYGPWGTAKSMILRDFCSRILGIKYFEHSVNETVDPAEILGRISFNKLEKEDQYWRLVDGMLPDCHVAFLDEVMNMSRPVRNTMLSIINERKFTNGGKVFDCPLISLVGGTNWLPEDDHDLPFFDRFLFRHKVQNVQEPENRMKMFKGALRRWKHGVEVKPKTTITLAELQMIIDYVNEVEIPDLILDIYSKLILNLENKGISISSRRQVDGLKAIIGHAVLNKTEITTRNFIPLCHVFWTAETDISKVQLEVRKLESPYRQSIRNIEDQAKGIYNKYRKFSGTDKEIRFQATNAFIGLQKLKKNLTSLLQTLDLLKDEREYANTVLAYVESKEAETRIKMEGVYDEINS